MLASVVRTSKCHYCYSRERGKIVVVCIWWYVDEYLLVGCVLLEYTGVRNDATSEARNGGNEYVLVLSKEYEYIYSYYIYVCIFVWVYLHANLTFLIVKYWKSCIPSNTWFEFASFMYTL